MHFKRWRKRAVLWFENLNCYSATLGKPEGDLSAEQEANFKKADTMFMADLFSVLGDNIVDPYMSFDNGKDTWEALEPSLGSRTLALSCMSWSNSMTTRWLMSAPSLSKLMRYNHLPKNLSCSNVPYQTNLWSVALLPSFLPRGGTLVLL